MRFLFLVICAFLMNSLHAGYFQPPTSPQEANKAFYDNPGTRHLKETLLALDKRNFDVAIIHLKEAKKALTATINPTLRQNIQDAINLLSTLKDKNPEKQEIDLVLIKRLITAALSELI